MKATKAAKFTIAMLLALLVVAVCALFFIQREERVSLLFAVSADGFDQAAYDHFNQTLAANASVRKLPLASLSQRQLNRYDTIYLDYNLKHTPELAGVVDKLSRYVEQGGHLFLENDFAGDFPAAFLGGSALIQLGTPKELSFEYPDVDLHLQNMQQVFRLFVDSFASQNQLTDSQAANGQLNALPGYNWGYGMTPSTAETLVRMNGASVMTANRYGKGTVLWSSALLPTHYYITGFDLASGIDPEKGFAEKQKQAASSYQLVQGGTYFRFKNEAPLQPYFHFAFATANYQLRNAYLDYVSKEKLGYSVTKIHGPYGRPAMAYQNHFEVASAYFNKEGVQWTELLRKYNQIPSFSIVRSSYEWNEWFEDLTVHLNTGTTREPVFTGQLENSFYGSGMRLASEGRTLTLEKYPVPTQLGDKLDNPYRAYPAFADLDGDGRSDLIAGSADGRLYLFRNLGSRPEDYADQRLPEGLAPPDSFGKKELLLTSFGKELQLPSGYSAPAIADLNGDGMMDLAVGDKDGRVWLAYGKGDLRFGEPAPARAGGIEIRVDSYAAPTFGDYDGDGITDLVVGDGLGQVYGFRGVAGKPGQWEKAQLLFTHTSRYAAPAIRDMNGNGVPDIVTGSQDGDVTVYIRSSGGTYSKQGTLNGATSNQVNTKALVGGHNSVPLWTDLNHDGKEDLVVGQLEFGLPVPLDDPSFPYPDEVKKFVDYAKANKLELYPHLFFHSYLSDAQEKREIELHRQMFEKLGIPWTAMGTNQHTWRINNADRLQTLRNENEAGLWFNFGFRPPNNPMDPQYGQDYVWSMPFLLEDSKLARPMVLSSPNMIFRAKGSDYATEDIYRAYAQLDMPIIYFDHIEYKLPGQTNLLLPYVTFLDQLRNAENYNFMTEPQLARSALTTLKTQVHVKQTYAAWLIDKVKSKLGRGVHLTLTLSADTSKVSDGLAGVYKNTPGVKIEPGKPYQGSPLGVDSRIYSRQNGALYTGLGEPVKLTVDWSPAGLHLERSNVPFRWAEVRDGEVALQLLDGGMQQVKLYSPTPLEISGDNLKIEQSEAGQPEQMGYTYTVTHYGEGTTVTLKWAKD
ncbi:MAG: alpha integrin [Paenibacillaceae bacterium]|nr:alpha integrin [Paenibacillaceae bacterium]